MVAGGLLLVAILASGGWLMLHDRGSPPTVSTVAPAAPPPEAHSPQDRRLSVIVLPFENSSGDPRQDDLAAGITRDVTDRIARTGVKVTPEPTAASYRGKTVNLQTLAHDHNVHFALTGSARRQDGRLIVSATLYDETGADKTLWSQRFDRPDNSDEWNGVISQIWNNFIQAATDAEVERAKREHPDNLDKRDLMLAYNASSLSSPSKENYLKSIALIERALAIDPDYVAALVEKAQMYALLVVDRYSSDPSADLSTARKAVDRALQLAPDDIWALRRKALILQAQGDLEGAAALNRKLLEREPLDGWRYRQLGIVQMLQGHFKEALENFTTAKRLGGSPPLPAFSQSLALGLVANDRFPEAIAEARLAIAQWPSDVGRPSEFAWLALIAAESENGQDAEARADLQKFLATPRTYRTLAEVQQFPQFAANRKLLDGLQRAGMPAE
jgi:TolB-like protein/tetratricopeptide (TPR) repeat protein